MAGNDTAALVVALSAQVSKFQKDMDQVNGIADKAVKKIEDRFTAANGVINAKFKEIGSTASSNLGFVGNLLQSLGPVGIAAAVGIGSIVAALIALAHATSEFASKSKALKEGAETAGLTITQFKLLGQQGKLVGLDFEETTAFFTKFIANIEALRQGGGPLFDALLKIDVALLRQLSTTKDSATAIDLLIKAFARLEDQTKKLDLARAAGGRAGLTGSRLLDSLGNQGGLSGLEAKSPGIDEGQIKRAAQLKVEIEAIETKTKNIWGGMFSDQILNLEFGVATAMNEIAKAVERIVGAKERSKALDDSLSGDSLSGTTPLRITVNKPPVAAPPPPTGAGSPSVELAILQKNLALLGEAVTQGEQWRLKRLEIAAAAEKGGLMDGIANRALAAFNVTMRAAALATRERLGVASQQEIVDVRLAQLQQDKIKFGLKENEVQLATVIIMRESKDAADALAVRQSKFPELTRELIDAGNATKQFDRIATSSLNSAADAFADVVTGTKSVKDAVHDMANSLIRDLSRASFKSLISSLLPGSGGNLLSVLFGNSSGAQPVNIVGANGPLATPTFAGGGVMARDGLARLHAGETIFTRDQLSALHSVIPDSVMNSGGSGSNVNVNYTIDARGADSVQVARLQASLDQHKRELPGIIVTTVNDARRRSVRV